MTIPHFNTVAKQNTCLCKYVCDKKHKSKRKAMNRNWYNQKANPALNTKAGNK